MPDLRKSVAIVGAAESDEIGVVEHKSALQHHAEAAHNALEDAGLAKSDVDGLFTAGFSTLATGEYLGIQPRYTDTTAVGGASFVIHVAHAMAAINAGYCEVALITHGQSRPQHAKCAGQVAAEDSPSPTCPVSNTSRPTASSARRSTTRWPAPATCTSTARTAPGRRWRR